MAEREGEMCEGNRGEWVMTDDTCSSTKTGTTDGEECWVEEGVRNVEK